MGRKVLRLILQVFGFALMLSGSLWVLQGLGLLQWPAGSFMLGDASWAFNGAITALVGAILWWASTKLRG